MIRYRPFRNPDPPALAALWNRTIPELGAVRPVRVHELDDHAFGSVVFDRAGLVVAEAEGEVVGFAHAGFGPDLPIEQTPPLTVSTAMGTIAMLAVAPGPDADAIARELVLRAEGYLRRRGAGVIYGGGRWPINPFYWGLYGGSESSGIPSGHVQFRDTLQALGYEPIGVAVSLQIELDRPEPRDPRAILIRRQSELEAAEESLPGDWWQNQAIGVFHLARFLLRSRSDGAELASARIYDMSWFGRSDGRSRIALTDVEVVAGQRRRGYGRYLVTEVLRWAREHGTSLVEVQTMSSNQPALAFYTALGFHPVDECTSYRLPASLLERADSSPA